MTSQLSLIQTGADESTEPDAEPVASRPGERPNTGDVSDSPRTVSLIGRLDRRTITRGQRGVAAARAELQDATARAAERQRARMAERIARLEELSHRSRPAATEDGSGPGTEHRAA
jgi:hypothetical protein